MSGGLNKQEINAPSRILEGEAEAEGGGEGEEAGAGEGEGEGGGFFDNHQF